MVDVTDYCKCLTGISGLEYVTDVGKTESEQGMAENGRFLGDGGTAKRVHVQVSTPRR